MAGARIELATYTDYESVALPTAPSRNVIFIMWTRSESNQNNLLARKTTCHWFTAHDIEVELGIEPRYVDLQSTALANSAIQP